MDKLKVNNDLTKSISDTSLLRFDKMKYAYGVYEKEDSEQNNAEIKETVEDSYNDNSYLQLANLWVDAYSKTTGKDENPGISAFEGSVTSKEFNRGMEIAKYMQGGKIEDYAERIAVEFGIEKPFASEAIIYFMANPMISEIFQIDCSNMSAEHAAETIKDKVLAENTPEELAAQREEYRQQEAYQPLKFGMFFSNSKHQEEQKQEEQKQEEKPEEQHQEQNPEEQNNTNQMPTISVEDFSPKNMYDMFGNVDFDGENLIIIGPDGEEYIDENPDEALVKTAMMNRIWLTTCINMEPDPSDERIDEIEETLFVGDNAIILNSISQMLLQENITSVDTIIKRLTTINGVQNKTAFIHKACDFLSNLAQFGNMDLDFKGVQPRKAYIELMHENSAPERI